MKTKIVSYKLEWLKAQEMGYQSPINAILWREMLATVRSAGTTE